MAHTRRLQGVVHQANGNPWAGFAFRITLTPSRPMPHATLPSQTITIGTDATGQYSVDLEVNATYLIEEVGSYAQSGSSTRYPRGSQYTITMPDGDTPVSLEELRSGDIVIPGGSALPDIVQEIADDLVAHEQDMDNPHSVTAAQVGLGNVADLGPANLPISTATQNALDLKADDADLTAHEQNFGNPHNVTAAQLPDLDSEVSASPDVAANTAARHGHSNKSLLDSYDQTNADISATITDRHTHSNKVTLDQTQEPYTTADKQTLDALALAGGGYGDVVTHDVAEFATAAQGAKADTAVQIETDPTVPSWAKQPAKPSYAVNEISNAVPDSREINGHDLTADVTLDATDVGAVVEPAVQGNWYQILQRGTNDPVWVDPSGPIPLLIATPDGSVQRDGAAVTVTPSASVEVRDSAWWLCEGTVNVARTRPGIGDNWAVRTEIVDLSKPGGFYNKYTGENIANGNKYSSVVAGNSVYIEDASQKATYSNWEWIEPGASASTSHQVRLNAEPNPDFTFWSYTVGTTPTYRAKTFDTGGGGTVTFVQFIRNRAWYPGDIWYLAGQQIEIKPYATPFVDGTRVDGTLSIPHTGKPDSILVRYREGGLVYNRRVILDGNGKGWFGRDNVGVIEYASNVLTVKTTSIVIGYARQIEVLGIATYDVVIPDAGLILTPQVWTMGNLPLVYAPPYPVLPVAPWQLFTPTHQTASGTTDLRVAPDGSAQGVKAMSAGTPLQVSTVIEGSYTRVNTTYGEGWVLTSQIISL